MELRRRSPVDDQTVRGLAPSGWSDFGGGDEDGVALDGDDELGDVAVADDPSELLLGDEHAES